MSLPLVCIREFDKHSKIHLDAGLLRNKLEAIGLNWTLFKEQLKEDPGDLLAS